MEIKSNAYYNIIVGTAKYNNKKKKMIQKEEENEHLIYV